MIVDDDLRGVAMLHEALSPFYQVSSAQTGAAALTLIAQRPPDVVLLDYVLPDKSGLGLLREVKEARPSVLVILITALGSEDLSVESFWAGARDYLKKPFGIPQLLARIEKLLATRRTTNEFRLPILVNVDVEVDLAVVPPNTLQARGHFDWSGNLLDATVAVLVAGIVGALISQFVGPFGLTVGWIGSTVAAILAIANYKPDLSSTTCSQSGSDFSCTVPLPLPTHPISGQAVVQFNAVAGASDGMVIFAQLDVGARKIQTVTVRSFLRSIHFNFADGLRSLGTPVVNAQYIGSSP